MIFNDFYAQQSQKCVFKPKKKSAYNRNLVWVYVVSESWGIGCMAMFAAFPSTIMDSTTMGRALEAHAPLLWRRPEA